MFLEALKEVRSRIDRYGPAKTTDTDLARRQGEEMSSAHELPGSSEEIENGERRGSYFH